MRLNFAFKIHVHVTKTKQKKCTTPNRAEETEGVRAICACGFTSGGGGGGGGRVSFNGLCDGRRETVEIGRAHV